MKKLISSLSMVAALAMGLQADANSTANFKKSLYSVGEAVAPKAQLQDTVAKIADDLVSAFKKDEAAAKCVAITSFVELNKLNKTTNFGRVMGESFYNELFKRGFNIVDFRMQKALVVNANGEYFLSRDVKKLNPSANVDYVLVGTYTQVEEGVLINTRIISSVTGKVVASSRAIYADKSCEIFENCKQQAPAPQIIYVEKEPAPVPCNKIRIETDNCTKETCPTICPTGVCK